MAVFGKPTKLPEWASGDAADVVEPTAGEKSLGWTAGQTPPAPYMNWLMGGDFGYFPWLQYVSTFEQQALTWPERQTFQKGVAASGQRSTIAGLDVTDGQTVVGGLGTDTLTATGAVSGATGSFGSTTVTSLSAGTGPVSGGAATFQSVTSGTWNPTTTDGTVVLNGQIQALGTNGNIRADQEVSGITGFFPGSVTSGSFIGPQSIEARHIVAATGVSLLNGWTAGGGGVWYYKDNANRLWLYVSAATGTVGLATPIFQLPVGWRPQVDGQEITTRRFASGATETMHLYVATNGNVSVYGGGFTSGAAMPAPGFIANGSIWLGA